MAQIGIDVTNIEASVPRDPIMKNGWVKAVITSSELVPGKKDPETSRRLNFNWKVVEGEFLNRTFSNGLNIVSPSAIAQEIARKDLSAIGHAVNVLNIQDSSQLHNLPMWVKIKYVAESGEYGAKNEPVGYKNQAEKVDPMTPVVLVGPTAGPANATAAFTPPAATFVPPAAPGGAAPTWQPPPGAPAWQAPAQIAPVETAPVAQAAPLQAPAAVAQVQTPAPVPAQPVAPTVAIDPTSGLAVPPWQQPAPPVTA
jgi:hypothetical protein